MHTFRGCSHQSLHLIFSGKGLQIRGVWRQGAGEGLSSDSTWPLEDPHPMGKRGRPSVVHGRAQGPCRPRQHAALRGRQVPWGLFRAVSELNSGLLLRASISCLHNYLLRQWVRHTQKMWTPIEGQSRLCVVCWSQTCMVSV